jgi:hypothetical protein
MGFLLPIDIDSGSGYEAFAASAFMLFEAERPADEPPAR